MSKTMDKEAFVKGLQGYKKIIELCYNCATTHEESEYYRGQINLLQALINDLERSYADGNTEIKIT